ncbi:hypothetical protein L227DRAFT_419187 [Lentinus tigrinus ALCF2SS1-6]|uniref:Uncharacterized protein n=1 Tax=Lentinus tigrinus ALCF2SS1-6 TaxID=1328759 RepID=A0A5C2SHT9_9APHY|nr:hypothetical protein L227DRAFT_419187 [Lentinus tigrinus ALCF2SS1-6]
MLLRSGVCALPAARRWAHDIPYSIRQAEKPYCELPAILSVFDAQGSGPVSMDALQDASLGHRMYGSNSLTNVRAFERVTMPPTHGRRAAVGRLVQGVRSSRTTGCVQVAGASRESRMTVTEDMAWPQNAVNPLGPSEAHRSVRDGRCRVFPDDTLPTQMLVRRSLRSRVQDYAVPRAADLKLRGADHP